MVIYIKEKRLIMVYDKMFEEFLEEIKLEGTYASMDGIREVS